MDMKALEAYRMKRGTALLKRMGRLQAMLDKRDAFPVLYDISVGHLFGEIWLRPHLSLRDRQLITLATNIALARPHGNHSHYRSAKHIGISEEEIVELIIQVAAYAGWAVVGHAINQYQQTLREDAEKAKNAAAKRRPRPAPRGAKRGRKSATISRTR
jgi:4-carboxymuconolactone decarboxylase